MTSRYIVKPGSWWARPQNLVNYCRSVHSPALVVITAHGLVGVAHEALAIAEEILTLVAETGKII